MSQRHHANPNLHLHFYPSFNGMPVQEKYLPMVTEYLEDLQETLEIALNNYPRVLAIRFDPVIPSVISDRMTVEDHQWLIRRFLAALKAIIKHDIERRRRNRWVPDTKVRYVWCREEGIDGKLHYHFFLILNCGTYHTIGEACSPHENLFNRISRAWYSGLGVEWNRDKPWIYVPENPWYRINRDNPESFQEAFYRASYLCKADTKQYGRGLRAFGSSRN